MECVHCDSELPENIHDTTYCNYNSPHYPEGTHTGDIYRCEACDELTIVLVQEGGRTESWSYQ
jgi:hypothetical protein